MKKIVAATLVASGLLAAPAYAGPTVTVRVEGQDRTLLERTAVTLPDTPSGICGSTLYTVADALDVATAKNWSRDSFVTMVMGESHTFTQNDYWAQWRGIGGGYQWGGGVCADVMEQGDEALMAVDISGPPPLFEPTQFALDLEGVPTAVEVGKPVTVTVVAYTTNGSVGSGTRTPVEGATVGGGGASAVTGAGGNAVLSFSQPGSLTLKASKPGSVRSAAEPVTVSATPVPPGATPPSPAAARAADHSAPTASFARLQNGRVFKRRNAPRRIAGNVTADPSGLLSVRLSILRKAGDRCWAFDGARERFERHRCGGRDSFRIGDRADWSYLLPKRLGRGRYTIRAVAIDKAGNESATRVVIRVR
jgi:hypothetical protein